MTRKRGVSDEPVASTKCVPGSPRVERALPVIRRMVAHVLGTRDSENEDIVHSVLERWLRAMRDGKARDHRAIAQLAAIVARNVAVDALRSRRIERRTVIHQAELSREDRRAIRGADAVDPERIAGARELLRWFGEALGELPQATAEVLYRHAVLGQELSEIAENAGITVAAAQSRLVRGRRRIGPLPDR